MTQTLFEHAFQGRVLGSIVVSIPACHAGDRGSIPRRGGFCFIFQNMLGSALIGGLLVRNTLG